MRCPTCRKPGVVREANAAFPFCSERCRLIDLGNWLGETYRVPLAEEDDQVEVAEDSSTPAGASNPSARRDTRRS
jgi:uncharacterized protein